MFKDCGFEDQFFSSSDIKQNKLGINPQEINKCSVTAFREIGTGRETMVTCTTIMNMQIKSNQTIYSFTWFLQILVYNNKNKMAKYLQWKIMCGETTCKEALCKSRPHNVKIKNKIS